MDPCSYNVHVVGQLKHLSLMNELPEKFRQLHWGSNPWHVR